ncbi:MAG TPA: substrate-binding domain-containing protein [Acidimicrobiia bacterium]|nr:substrate-binding domain-containing protein [Acidimicrobiia bacterium]
MKRRHAIWIALLTALAVLVAACGGDGASDTTADGGSDTTAAPDTTGAPDTTADAPDDQIVIGFSQANNGDVWRINQTNNVEEACSTLIPGAEVIVTDGQGEGSKQSADVDDLIARGVDVLLLTPLTADELTPAAERALDAGIPVITLDRSVNVEVTQHIGADNKLIGEKAAEFVSQTLLGGQGGTVIEIQGVLGASATTDRHDAFVAWLEANDPNVEIIESQTGEYRREPAFEFMNDMLQRYGPGEFDVVYTHNDEMALGAVQSMDEAGRLGEAAIVGIDGQNEAIQAIADGQIAATFTYDNAGKEACESAAALLAGESIDSEWVLETTQIDETNAEEWIGQGF